MTSLPERAEPGNVTLEDLLRIKRSERPAPEFWNRFERELRAKQLAAIIEKRPWWTKLRVPRAARYLSRLQIPVGAAAVLALSFAVVREYRPLAASSNRIGSASVVHPAEFVEPVEATVTIVPSAATLTAAMSAPVATSAPSEPTEPAAFVHADDSADDFNTGLVSAEPAVVVVAESAEAHPLESVVLAAEAGPASFGPGGLMALIPWAAPRRTAASAEQRQPVTIGELPQVHFVSAAFPGREHNFNGRVEVEPVIMAARVAPTVRPKMAEPPEALSSRDVRRSRILSSLIVADSTSEAERSRLAQMREVLTSALDDDRLYESVRRLGLGGDRLTLKF